ncbi:endonuclease/exonuclease/phosphatase family protein [Micromonospora sp. NBC_00898]|uniref:endonuclease/exonuclease/phosphatase family protein n=1 Tax=Micromonospora sp. NBC_00898 TaxID=2975981 RepID=UPI003870CE95|nr:endonuclease/exonuclease/phosphatase family protein [Micromonospora sp. NBC_00898]
MRHRHLITATLALGVVVLLDVLRVWLPSIITIFGQAAATPAELLGAFAVSWFLLALAAPALVRRLGARRVGLVAAGALAGVRLALTAAPGGQLQLWLACTGLLAGLLWLAATAAVVARPVPGLALGLVAAAVGHALLGTEDLVWRGGWPAWTLSPLLAAAFLTGEFLAARVLTGKVLAGKALAAAFLVTRALATGTNRAVASGGARGWLLAGPATLLAGQLALPPAVWNAAASYRHGSPGLAGLGVPAEHVPALPMLVVGLFLVATFTRPPRWLARVLWPAALLAGAVLFAADRPGWLGPAFLLAAAGLGGCLALADADSGPGSGPGTGTSDGSAMSGRRGYVAVGGMLVFAVASIAYYAAYDLGYPNGWVPVALAVLVAVVAVAGPPAAASVLPETALAWTVIGLMLLTGVAGGIHRPVPATGPSAATPGSVRVVAYNIRMGFGLDGRFDLDGLARAVTGSRPDVVVLSEVDRGWLLNGGHDTLALLARRLRMPYVFAPAADPVWGDAVLSRWPARSGETRPLPAVGAPTGAQVLGVTLDLGGGARLAVVATHLQPPPRQGPVTQARAVAAFATRYAAGRPLVLAGDLNTEPGDPAFAEFTRAGLVDALASARPLPTGPADEPREQIDHVFVSPGLGTADVAAPRVTTSDHLPVAVTLTLP